MNTRCIILDIVGLQPHHITPSTAPALASVLETVVPMKPSFPALTVPAQTTLATGSPPSDHGDVASGEYDRATSSVAFWERDRGNRTRLWERAREQGHTTGALFFQHLIGSTADVAITPAPIEDADNNLIEMNCWTNPDDFYETLREKLGHFPLHAYWGPGASRASSEWILDATAISIQRFDPDLLWVYLPHLDYAGLKNGPGEELAEAVSEIDTLVAELLSTLKARSRWEKTAITVVSEYGFQSVDTPVYPNRTLRDAGLLSLTEDSSGGTEVDFENSQAFAMVDHQIAHIYASLDSIPDAKAALAQLDGVETVVEAGDDSPYAINHPNAGELLAIANSNAWFQYYWWETATDAPGYARQMDIHAKPGFDPCELFLSDDGRISLDASRVGGSHGRTDRETWPVFGIGGPALYNRTLELPDPMDAQHVVPTIETLLGTRPELDSTHE
ncbi:alkaline phosphatase family protein [Halocatena halophila]|uniref:alkaline phosphatase family protein n=1 Tax=Halocatena halophila TaxID=2814576 RepID=UPI002ED599A3